MKRASLKEVKYTVNIKLREMQYRKISFAIPRIEELLDGFNINRFKIDGYELMM